MECVTKVSQTYKNDSKKKYGRKKNKTKESEVTGGGGGHERVTRPVEP